MHTVFPSENRHSKTASKRMGYVWRIGALLIVSIVIPSVCAGPLPKDALLDSNRFEAASGGSGAGETHGSYHGLTKRTQSVFPRPRKATDATVWPISENHGVKQNWITYCFEDEQSADDLLDLVMYGIARWQPATLYSNMGIAPEARCGKPPEKAYYKCICNKEHSGASLQIRSKGEESAEVRNTPVGYRTEGDYGRNDMLFVYSPKGKSPQEREEERLSMTHELGLSRQPLQISYLLTCAGHSIGLYHEVCQYLRCSGMLANILNAPTARPRSVHRLPV